MSTLAEINNDFAGSSSPSLSFKGDPGIAYRGRIADVDKRQARDMDSDELKFWDDAHTQPIWEYIFTLSDCEQGKVKADGTAYAGWAPVQNDDDHGTERRLFAKSGIITALRKALMASGAGGWEIGGTLTIGFYAEGQQKKRGWNPPKLFVADYVPPAPHVAQFDDQGSDEPW